METSHSLQPKKKHAHLSPRKEKEYKDEEDEETYASAVVLVLAVGVCSGRVGRVWGVIPIKETAAAAVGVRTAADSRWSSSSTVSPLLKRRNESNRED